MTMYMRYIFLVEMFVKVYSTNPQSSCQFSIVVHENVYTIVDDFFFPFCFLYVKERAYLQEAKHIRYYFINKNKQCYALREKGKITDFDVCICNVSLFSYLSHSLTHSIHFSLS